MPSDPKSRRFPSWFKKRQHPSQPPDNRSQVSTPPASNNQIIGPAIAHDRRNDNDHSSLRVAGLHSGALATITPALLLPGGTLQNDTTEQRTSSRDKLPRLFQRNPSPSPAPSRRNQSSTSQSKQFMSTALVQTPANDSRPPLSPPTEVNTNFPPMMVGNALATGNHDSSIHTQQESGPSVPTTSSVPAESVPRRSDGDLKKTIIGTTKLLLETAAAGLKFAPIAHLDQIPNTLLRCIQIYENVIGNTEELNQLCIVIQQAQESVVEPLRKWTGETPPELKSLVEEICVSLQKQMEIIGSVQKQHVVKKTIQASDITQQIANTKNCLNDAIHRFELRSWTLILLRIEHSSVQSELSRLKKVPAEHTCVTSKSECLPGTQVKIRKSLLRHLKNTESRFVWLRGSPGTGKTAISMSVASTLEKQGTLAASYFWDKNQSGTGLDSIEQFPSTLAHQLASFNEDFKLSLVRCLRKPALASVQNFPLEKQMRTLVIEPVCELKDIWSLGKDRVVIILDGLDECGNQETLKSLMMLVLTLQELPPAFAVLVSCRPEPGVISAWSKAQTKGFIIPCEDMDNIVLDAAFSTVRCMVVDGLQDLISESPWKPKEGELTDFARACQGLPVMASIRVRDVSLQTRRGRTLQSVFQELLNLTNAPANLNWEYLRILRQAYMLDSSDIHPDVAKKYRLVVGTIVVACVPMNIPFMSQLFKLAKDEICATLEPISSIVNHPLGDADFVTLYHATAKEFILGEPIGNEKDQVFFIDDVKGYFIGLPLLQLFNNHCEQDGFGVPMDPPLGDKRIWREFMVKKVQ
ncbi:uncharacterized protein EI90DRAFT_97281 [Cantharellus anzutake]|uniref:uncharacterized protein n=1 Tax=Cantharellus anzutake TaxID=1750568 RepID=UPI001904958B|nr:uncharacterized protein EI90DRAFT_97281 [Cantharellus anzutake]KAF8336988.1 hypothetical protein EI90DRAFT_97281 [Cantharellus anzutake]